MGGSFTSFVEDAKLLTVTVDLSTFPCISVNFHFMYFEVLLLGDIKDTLAVQNSNVF